jgi:hypothetical protein
MKELLFIIFLMPLNVMSQELLQIRRAPLISIELRKTSQEEIQSLNSEYQAGMELMFWLSKLEADTLRKDITLGALQDAFDSLNRITEYPIAEYNSVWHATFGLSIVFAEELRHDYGWEWVMIEDSPMLDVGWSLVSKDKKYAINVEQLFYDRIMRNARIDVTRFYDSIENAIANNKDESENILFFKLP